MADGTVSPKATQMAVEVNRELLETTNNMDDQMLITLVISAFIVGMRAKGVSFVTEDD